MIVIGVYRRNTQPWEEGTVHRRFRRRNDFKLRFVGEEVRPVKGVGVGSRMNSQREWQVGSSRSERKPWVLKGFQIIWFGRSSRCIGEWE